jgi:hypothetical protein
MVKEQNTREIAMYGMTEARMRDNIERSTTFKFSGPGMIVAGILSDAPEMFAYSDPSAGTIEEHRQLMNRAKWALFEYVMKDERNERV